ncbi:hypothetical protein KCV07_g531, partial [Aureobasidium melanogenum]
MQSGPNDFALRSFRNLRPSSATVRQSMLQAFGRSTTQETLMVVAAAAAAAAFDAISTVPATIIANNLITHDKAQPTLTPLLLPRLIIRLNLLYILLDTFNVWGRTPVGMR